MCKKDNNKTFTEEIYIKPSVRNYPTNKIIYNHTDEIRSIELADMIGYKILKNKSFRYKFSIFDSF